MDTTAAQYYRQVMTVDPPEGLGPEEQSALDRMFGEVWAAPALGRRERRLITITCAAFAVTAEPIRAHVYAALSSGDLTIDELLELVLHFAVYCGWPKASNLEMYVRTSWIQVQQERGTDPAPLPTRSNDELGLSDWEERLQQGEQEFRDVNLVNAPPRDSPYQHSGILNYVFGHVWQRPGLGRRDRRFVTLACVGLCRAPIPISSHVGSALRSGDLSKAEMDEVIRHFEAHTDQELSAPLAEAAEQTWSDMHR